MHLRMDQFVSLVFLSLVSGACSMLYTSHSIPASSPETSVLPPKAPENTPTSVDNKQWIVEESAATALPRSPASQSPDEIMMTSIDPSGSAHLEGNPRFWVSAAKLNVRSGPSARYQKLGTLIKGTRVTVLERRGDWVRIEANQWISRKYIQAEP